MKLKGILFCAALLLAAPAFAQISGEYVEFRTADVYTGPCFANGEVNLTGQEAVLGWKIENGRWGNVDLDGLGVVAVVQASATLGDAFADPLPAKAVFLVDERANDAQRTALVHFAQAQTNGLLNNVVAIQAVPIQFAAAGHAAVTLEAGDMTRISTRPVAASDAICHNEEVFYQPLAANLHHAMPAVALEGSYRGNHLGVTWKEQGRRGAFVAAFSF